MPDIIHLLSDHLANQIAAGEVIQRPASAVKELLENAIDAGATSIHLNVKEAGKELIQVVDNGKGMSPTDARMSFERHATSKIKDINDLFSIKTKGFRGEALASIAAVAQVEMKTRQPEAEMGTHIIIESSEVKKQEPCVANAGTSFAIKNLFYNVPARRHFLKTNNSEYKHIVDEFTRIALAHPEIGFKLTNNQSEQFNLLPGTVRNRIVNLLGNQLEKRIVPVEESTDVLTISGFIGKPEAATKTRGMQFFFMNKRFIKNNYLHHAVMKAFEGIIEKEYFPFYVLFLEVDPARVDVNVHPTKQEVKFEDDQLIYAYLNAAVKHALARFNVAPSLDFSLSPEIQRLQAVNVPMNDNTRDQTERGYLFNVFQSENQAHVVERKDSLKQWKSLYEIAARPEGYIASAPMPSPGNEYVLPSQGVMYNTNSEQADSSGNMMLIHGTYLATPVKSGVMLIHVRRAQERITYERLLRQYNDGSAPSQQVLFPVTYELPPQDALLLKEIAPDLKKMGFSISYNQDYSNEQALTFTFMVDGTPPSLPAGEEKNIIDEILENIKHEAPDAISARTETVLAQMAVRMASGAQAMNTRELQEALVDELFACAQPEYSPRGRKVFAIILTENMEELLG